MKFVTLLENFKKAINLGERISGKNFTLPILSNLLIESKKNKICVSATDLEIGVEILLTGQMEEEKENEKIVVPAKILANFVNHLSEEKVLLETKNQNLIIRSGKYQAEFLTLNPEDFPIIPKVKTIKNIEVNKEEIKQSLERVIPAISPNASRSELTGVYFDLNGKTLKIVGTDSYRLAEKTIKLTNDFSEKTNFIIPFRTAIEVSRMIADNIEEELDHQNLIIYPESNQIQFNLGNTRLISQLINGEYPQYEAIIPKEFENEVVVGKKELLESIKIVGLFASRVNDIFLTLNPDKKEINLVAQDQTFGKGQTSLKTKTIQGNHLSISFDYRYLLDGISVAEGDFVFLGFNKDNNPALIRGEEERDFLYVLMPIKI